MTVRLAPNDDSTCRHLPGLKCGVHDHWLATVGKANGNAGTNKSKKRPFLDKHALAEQAAHNKRSQDRAARVVLHVLSNGKRRFER